MTTSSKLDTRLGAPVALAEPRGLRWPAWLRPRGAWLNFALPITLLIIWQIVASLGVVRPSLLPTPGKVLQTLWEITVSGKLFGHLSISSVRWISGALIGGSLGLLLGSLVGLSRLAEQIFDTSVQMLRTVPFLAMTPLLVLWLGLDEAPKITLIALATFFPMYMNTFAGIRNVDRKLIEVGRMYELSPATMLRRVILPAALPEVLTGLRYGLGVAWLALVVAELMGATRGLGYMLSEGREFVRVDIVLCSILIFSLAGKLVDFVVRLLEARLLRWRDTFAGGA
jgi:sulfonate transport system permease protein